MKNFFMSSGNKDKTKEKKKQKRDEEGGKITMATHR